MFITTQLAKRNLLGLWIGFMAGLSVFFAFPALNPNINKHFVLAIIVWYAFFGIFISMVGMFDYFRVTNRKEPWWLRGPGTGVWLNTIVVLFAPDELRAISEGAIELGVPLKSPSPWYFILNGALLGLVIDGICTKIFGDGKLIREL